MKLYKLTISCNCTSDTLRAAKTYFETKVAHSFSLLVKDIKAKSTNRNFGIRRGDKLGFLATMYGKKAHQLLTKVEATMSPKAINKYGACQLGLSQYTQLTLLSYLPDLPNFGFSLNFIISVPGWCAQYKRRAPGKPIRVSYSEVRKYLENNYKGITINDH